jgi:hypothetical protein
MASSFFAWTYDNSLPSDEKRLTLVYWTQMRRKQVNTLGHHSVSYQNLNPMVSALRRLLPLFFVSSTTCTAFLSPAATRLLRPVISHRSKTIAFDKNDVDYFDYSSFLSSLPSFDNVRNNIFEVRHKYVFIHGQVFIASDK